jgi:hypothetical protein
VGPGQFVRERKMIWPLKLSSRIESQISLYYPIQDLVCPNQLINVYVNEICILNPSFSKGTVLAITLVMLKKTKEQEITNFSPCG